MGDTSSSQQRSSLPLLRQSNLWQRPRAFIVIIFLLVGSAAVCLALLLPEVGNSGQQFIRIGALLGFAVMFEEAGRRVARMLHRIRGAHYADLSSVWIMAAVVLLHAGAALVFVACFRAYLWVRQHRPEGIEIHRELYTWASISWSTLLAGLTIVGTRHAFHATLPSVEVPLGLLLAVVVFVVANTATVALAVRLSYGPQPLPALFGSTEENLIEFASLCLGVLAALAAQKQPLLIAFAVPLAVVLQRASLVSQLEQDAATDPKTGLLNAVAWNRIGIRELARAERTADFVSVLMFDLDHFKQVNDQFGHIMGDEAIVAIADLLRGELRDYDHIARFGGEEFVALLPKTAAEDAWQVAERIRRAVMAVRVGDPIRPGPVLSVSVGLACAPEQGTTIDVLLRAADDALYRAKAGGRNQVVMAGGGSGSIDTMITTPLR